MSRHTNTKLRRMRKEKSSTKRKKSKQGEAEGPYRQNRQAKYSEGEGVFGRRVLDGIFQRQYNQSRNTDLE